MASTTVVPSTTPTTPKEKYDLIVNNLQEVLNPEIIHAVLEKNERPLSIYWGTATTGRPHCGYFVPCLQIAKFLAAGCKVTVLLADIHGFLDNLKAPIELVEYRAVYYKFVITELLKAVGVDISRLEFVLGSSYQLSKEYTMDRFRLESVVTQHDAKKAGAEVVKQVENATLSSLIYPVMQALDEEYLKVDAQFGGVDQRKIFALAKEVLPKIGYKERAHLMNPMVPGLAGGKMSASDPDSKIDVLDDADVVKKKLKKAFAMPKVVEDNGILSFVEYVVLPAGALKAGQPRFVVERRPEEGEPLVYSDIKQIHKDYESDVLTPQLLKQAATTALNELLAPIQAAFKASSEWQDIEKKAYPPPPEKKKKEKKDKGSRHPGAVQAKPDGHVEGSKANEVSLGKDVKDAMSNLNVNGS
ncbi:tyrosine-tRNA ligase [Sphaceloma murrayae]|uniref:Tyrosine--tRNA ligase n=1 Tax=Sphaceloma murrayae TaxID=2082308 RepID=A0A2K1QJT4_9PEZI|nr:tyrosine-tRNA ligase [Sphaceloma murrayae]